MFSYVRRHGHSFDFAIQSHSMIFELVEIVVGIFIPTTDARKSLEQNRPLYMYFVDRVPRFALWIVLRKAGCSEKNVNIIRQFYNGMIARVQHV